MVSPESSAQDSLQGVWGGCKAMNRSLARLTPGCWQQRGKGCNDSRDSAERSAEIVCCPELAAVSCQSRIRFRGCPPLVNERQVADNGRRRGLCCPVSADR